MQTKTKQEMQKLSLCVFRYPGLMMFLLTGVDVIRVVLADCGKPAIPHNGFIRNHKDKYTTGEEIRYFCKTNSLLFGQDTRRCQANHTWSEEVPVCRTATKILKGFGGYGAFSFLNKMLDVSVLNDRNPETCMPVTKFFNQALPKFKLYIKEEINVLAVRIIGSTSMNDEYSLRNIVVEVFSQEERHTCNYYFHYSSGCSDLGLKMLCLDEPVSENEITVYCEKKVMGDRVDISGSGSLPANQFVLCEVEVFVEEDIQCGVPDLPYNGSGQRKLNSSVEAYQFTCKDGYYLNGSKTTYCSKNGTWHPNSPRCIELPIVRENNQSIPEDNFQNLLLTAITPVASAIICLTICLVIFIRRRKRIKEMKRSNIIEDVVNVQEPEEQYYVTIIDNNAPLDEQTQDATHNFAVNVQCSSDCAHVYADCIN